MNILKIYSENDLEIFAMDASEVDLQKAEKLLSQYRFDKVKMLRNDEKKQCSAAAELLLRHALKMKDNKKIKYSIGVHGKPYFQDGKIKFSISHSGHYAICAVSQKNVGADIQMICRKRDAIAKRYFNEEEMKIADCDIGFSKIWSRKEAVAKADGRGLGVGLENIDASCRTVLLDGKRYRLMDIPFFEDAVIAVALEE